ncbi:DNA-directed RNA polymerase subunit omega [Mesoaciditoga lauensis]|uniref:DNA-directed RNA polymerase subunit omega n=1 Tax=Mesoaciditoga lauensis TaxID=1495039 RepID=UPI00056D6C39|nr:DNA-directed RNA polymerase subunit omega [Mesoaciditoga lauensis]
MKEKVYETLMNKYGNKYAITMAAAKRAENLNELSRPLVKTNETNLVSIALEEMAEGYVEIKNFEMLKALVADVKKSKE